MKEHPDHFLQAFDLTSTQEANVQICYSEFVSVCLRMELNVPSLLSSAKEVAVFGQLLQTAVIDRTGTAVKKGSWSTCSNDFQHLTPEKQK